MNNGDKLTGTILRVNEQQVVIETSYNPQLEVARDQVESLVTEQPVTVRLDNGDVLTGRLATTDGELQVEAAQGRSTARISWDQVATINVPPPPPWTWSGNLFLGGNQQSGNTDRTSLSLGFDALRKSSRDRYNLSFLFNYAEEAGDLTTRDYFGSVKYDYFFTSKVYGYLVVEMLKDQFKDLNLRTMAGPGAGYQVWDDDDKYLSFDAGVSYFSEDHIQGEDDQWLTGRLGAKFSYRLLDKVNFSDNLTIFPSLENASEYTSRNEAVLTTTIAGPWSLRLSNIWEYDSAPGPGIEQSDLKSGANLQYSF